MANPFASKAKSTSASKYKALTGKASSGQTHPDGAQDSKAAAAKSGKNTNEYKVGGVVGAGNFARGGRSKGKGHGKKGTHINIAVIGGKDKDAAPPMMPPPGLPPGGPPMAPPPGMAPPGAGGPPPPGMPPMKRGGKVSNTGAGGGNARIDKIKAYGLSPKKAG